MALSAILKILTGPIAGIIDKVVKDADLATKIKHDILSQMMNYEGTYMKEASAIIQAEANSGSWLTRSWRPITMLFFVAMLGMYWLGYAPDYLIENPAVVQELFALLKIGIGGYIIGRSAEKIATTTANVGGVKKMLG